MASFILFSFLPSIEKNFWIQNFPSSSLIILLVLIIIICSLSSSSSFSSRFQACFKQTDTSCQILCVITNLKALLHPPPSRVPRPLKSLPMDQVLLDPPPQRIQLQLIPLLGLEEDWLEEIFFLHNTQAPIQRTFTALTISLHSHSRGLNCFLNRSYSWKVMSGTRHFSNFTVFKFLNPFC